MRNISLILIFLIAFIGACVDPLDVNLDREVNILIVEGSITTKPGTHYIRLTRSAKYGNILDGFIRPVERSKVIIRDSDGNNFNLIEIPEAAGIYATPGNFLAEVGKSYTLIITTANGTEYTSLPEKILKAPEILELSTKFNKIELSDDQFKSGLDVEATFQDNPEEQNFYMWKNNGTYQTITYPEDHKIAAEVGGPLIIPAPKDCCKDCWVNEIAELSLRLLTDNNVNGNLLTTPVVYIEDDGIRFADKYLVRIEQHTLTREAYQFFRLLKDQISINGDIFDPPPATLRGNMINLSNPDENVIGYFRASDVSIDSLFLTKDMLLEKRQLIKIDDDCRAFRGGSAVRPSYW